MAGLGERYGEAAGAAADVDDGELAVAPAVEFAAQDGPDHGGTGGDEGAGRRRRGSRPVTCALHPDEPRPCPTCKPGANAGRHPTCKPGANAGRHPTCKPGANAGRHPTCKPGANADRHPMVRARRERRGGTRAPVSGSRGRPG
ncbi:hypothetical protein GCM10009779_36930 [Polymorphospora rubra]|uniref:Uncharacterized protein n=1 Tax=Polymorphospora rubra TaxID=338584 RepID=A0A810MQ76_9ACTN|nr:hypothetical protein Prubr_04080 [Polymorphospora rubra]